MPDSFLTQLQNIISTITDSPVAYSRRTKTPIYNNLKSDDFEAAYNPPNPIASAIMGSKAKGSIQYKQGSPDLDNLLKHEAIHSLPIDWNAVNSNSPAYSKLAAGITDEDPQKEVPAYQVNPASVPAWKDAGDLLNQYQQEAQTQLMKLDPGMAKQYAALIQRSQQ